MGFWASMKDVERVVRSGAKLCIAALAVLMSCASPQPATKSLQSEPLRTENVIIVVIDGPRYSETWAATPGLIPNMSGKLKGKGGFLQNFYNDAYTYTNSGHAAITTGVNQPIDNYGEELPANPSIFQYFLKQSGKPATAAWIVSSKDKLHILTDTQRPDWQGTYQPSFNGGISGPGSGYRMDSLTLEAAISILATHKPNLMLINFMEPDGYAHAGNSENYLRGISRTDRYVKELWDFVSRNSFYRKKTTLIITNDHGRHLDGVDGGWMEHGDNCEGCQKISLLALGPDFKKGREVEARYTLVDIAPTVAHLLGFKMDPAVLVPKPDTTMVEFAVDSTLATPGMNAARITVKMEPAVLEGQVIKELFK
ncbi:sulfatase-like hydrolase/transferase [Pontibacter pamirensis]|uniref:sulfatase-like hydrolase/transferase n=1 Tax=Pontibacter pamirensis TaxID=2562824 RepID=UPI001F018D99|nr:sulfatase-like hydrolase/transferase [Pontibacter pamirensis]